MKNKELILKLFIFYILSFSVISYCLLSVYKNVLENSSTTLVEVVRGEFVVGNVRETVRVLKKAGLNSFSKIEIYFASRKEPIFLQSTKHSLVPSRIRRDIFFDSKNEVHAGRLVFFYDRVEVFIFILFTFSIFVILTFPLLISLYKRQRSLVLSESQREHGKALAMITKQVSHDIKSPLASIESMLNDYAKSDEKIYTLFKMALTRIKEVIYDLDRFEQRDDFSRDVGSIFISLMTSDLVEEKRIEVKNKNVSIVSKLLDAETFVKAVGADFKRILSNVINNSVESIPEGRNGVVEVEVLREGDHLNVIVRDNGKGISQDKIDFVFEKGKTFGKENGQGLGLYYAKEVIERWGGRIDISSRENIGTEVVMRFKKVTAPSWFISSLNVSQYKKVFILDDNQAIAYEWEKKLPEDLRIYSFSNLDSLETILKSESDISDILFLIDYDFGNKEYSGIDIIVQKNLVDQSILVTNNYETNDVLQRCEELSIKLLPKPFLSLVETTSSSTNKEEHVLIDDDPLVRLTWEETAKRNNVLLETFDNIESFIDELGRFSKEADIFIDSNLGNGIKGEDVAIGLYTRGYRNLHLATGDENLDLNHFPHLKSIQGKLAPWA